MAKNKIVDVRYSQHLVYLLFRGALVCRVIELDYLFRVAARFLHGRAGFRDRIRDHLVLVCEIPGQYRPRLRLG